jgi:hypothetical protein
MTTSEHTPGPWAIDDYGAIRADMPNDDGCVEVAHRIYSPLGLDYGNVRTRPMTLIEAQANARLIAAAPDLLEAIEGMIEWFVEADEYADYEELETVKVARKAIAKAKGAA